ncbi:hypothetical protein OAN43_00390 [Candidatus Pelagibacter sp.]|nr:hypothetical protein [Candidatus Pelagibacter sp.]
MFQIPRKIIFSSGFIFILLIFPIYLMNGDNWDGVHIEFAYIIDDLSGIKTFLFNSGWYLQFYLSEFIISAARYINFPYFKTNGLIVYFFFILFLYENYFISKKIFKLNNNQNIWYLVFISTFPVFSTLSSSIMTFHFVCFTFSLLALRLIHTTKNLYILTLCLFILLASFNFNSLIIFIPMLSICYDFLINNKLKISTKSLSVFLISAIAITLRLFFLIPSGVYENYNRVSFASLSNLSFFQFIELIIPFISYPAVSFILSLFFILIIYLCRFKLNQITKKKILDFLKGISLPILIFISAIISYLVVFKTTSYAWIILWNSRQSILTCIPLGLFLIIYFNQILNFFAIENRFKLKFFNFYMLILIIFNITIFSSFILNNLNRDIFEKKLIESLRLNFENSLDQGTVIIYGENIPGSYDKENNKIGIPYRFYELNYLLYKTFMKRDYLVQISHSNKNKDFFDGLINTYAQTYENRILYIIGDNLNCHSNIEIETNNFIGKLNILKNILHLQNPSVKIKKSKTNCS